MTQQILLNFLSITPSKFNFTVWRKQYFPQEKKVYVYNDKIRHKLPSDEDTNEFKDFWIDFSTCEGYSKYKCNNGDNPYLTIEYLFQKIQEQIIKNFEPNTYKIYSKFEKRIEISMDQFPQGNQCLVLEPYYLKINKSFGILINFKFTKLENQDFNREV